MTSASTTSARSLFEDSRNRLAEKVQVNLNNVASIVRQIQRGSKSHEVMLLTQQANQLANLEKSIDNTQSNLNKFPLLVTHLNTQQEVIESNLSSLRQLKSQLNELQQSL